MHRSHFYWILSLTWLALSCQQKPAVDNAPVDPTRFEKVKLAQPFDEPMEIAITPEGDVYIIERKGALKRFDHSDSSLSVVHQLPVFFGLEDGLLGMALDPHYSENHFVYLFYSPVEDTVQRVSRFVLQGDSLHLASEKKIIEIPTQRHECCHSAGSLAFGDDNNLYIAVGDNTNPHNPGYYNSVDERKGREFWDAQRTAGNTNDLRGKILRIHIEADGTYTIPAGNLFKPGQANARAEIYAMGCRNPYRISVDAERQWLFWGDVGQNTIDDPSRGPISYDEWHVARSAGFFGWPYFAGPNAPYAAYDYNTGVTGPFHNAAKPENKSVNNTGLRELPAATGALIWYSYNESKEFPHLGTGGKSPIAGPVYYASRYGEPHEKSVAFPAYYSGKLFIAEWMRDWVNVVTLTGDGKVQTIEPFMKQGVFHHPIDLEFGPEGALYVLEYGTNWFSPNSDAGLYKIQYRRGNRPPVAKATANVTAGEVPLKVSFSSRGTHDPDSGDVVTYAWHLNGSVQSREAHPSFTFDKAGAYTVRLQVTDAHGVSSESLVTVKAGNAVPELQLRVLGNQTFYWPQVPVRYEASVSDREDGAATSSLTVALSARALGSAGVDGSEGESPVWEMIQASDCKACHALNDRSVGPSYQQIAARYQTDASVTEKLARKVISGGAGAWGEAAMSAHPQLSMADAMKIVSFILTLADERTGERSLPATGSFTPAAVKPKEEPPQYVLTARYTDKPVPPVGSNQVQQRVVLRHATMPALRYDTAAGIENKPAAVQFSGEGAFIAFRDIDLSGVGSIVLRSDAMQRGAFSITFDHPDGRMLPATVSQVASGKVLLTETTVPLGGISGRHTIFVSLRAADGSPPSPVGLISVSFQRSPR